MRTVFRGTVVQSAGPSELLLLERAAVVVGPDGIIEKVLSSKDADAHMAAWTSPEAASSVVVKDFGARFLVPGLIDTHAHAPQYAQLGTGTDLPLLEWLNKYTFPTESRFADPVFARRVYSDAVRRTLRNGTTSCVWFASLHLEASKVLVDVCSELGQHAFVGKVCMDRNSPDHYREPSAQASLAATREFVAYARARDGGLGLVTPIVTPRFAISCSSELMRGLGELAAELGLPIQSHIGENCSEISFTHELHPENKHYADVYHSRGLLTSRTIMAHAVHLSDAELDQFAQAGAGASHCPRSNLTLCSGLAPVRKLQKRGIKVGLGTDMSGGPSASMWDAMRGAIETSVAVSFSDPNSAPLSYKEAFYLATMGGASLLCMEDRVGSLEPGKWFNAQIVNPHVHLDTYGTETTADLFQKCFYLLDDRNIEEVYVKGRKVIN